MQTQLYDGKDKTFFFFNWERGRQVSAIAASIRTVATEEFRNGDFSKLTRKVNGVDVPIVLRDPLNVGIKGNVIPKSALSQQIQTFLKFTPLPNRAGVTSNFINNPISALGKQDNYTARIDHNFSGRDSVSGRYIFNDTFEAGNPY